MDHLQYLPLFLGGLILCLVTIMAIFAPWIATYDPANINPMIRLKPPSILHYFGTDSLGRDVFSRVVWGARVSLIVAVVVACLSIMFGAILGMIAGFVRMVDTIIMRVVDGMMAIPDVLLAIALVALTEPSLTTVIIAITVPQVPRMIRLVRSIALSVREYTFVEAARAAGTPLWVIIVRHVAPNIVAPIVVEATFIAAAAVLTEAGLSFLGVGVPSETPSWGNIVADGRNVITLAFNIILFPSLFIALTVLSINSFGDGLRDFMDPRLANQI